MLHHVEALQWPETAGLQCLEGLQCLGASVYVPRLEELQHLGASEYVQRLEELQCSGTSKYLQHLDMLQQTLQCQ